MNTISRRRFSQRILRVLMYGGLSHFLLPSNLFANDVVSNNDDDCPGGIAPTDICSKSEENEDECPGEKPPADECPADGNQTEDICNSGLSEADVCKPDIRKSDQCQTGLPADDQCPNDKPPRKENSGDDICPSGRMPEDSCPADGDDAAGDQCPGGGPKEDTCKVEAVGTKNGDECSSGTYGSEDDCKEYVDPDQKDRCSVLPLDDDSCPNGKNATNGYNGGDDWCEGNVWASDECYTGTDEDDLCIGKGGNGQSDCCPEGLKDLDLCNEVSDDYCVAGIRDSDECPSGKYPEDECAGGTIVEDVCYMHVAKSDECDPLSSGSDQGGCKVSSFDECIIVPLADFCSLNRDTDIAE